MQMNVGDLHRKSIIDIFSSSNKAHLVVTGAINSGKTTLAQEYIKSIKREGVDQITTFAKEKQCVYFKTNYCEEFVVATYDESVKTQRCKMKIVENTFSKKCIDEIEKCINSSNKWCIIDEIGYVENSVKEYQNAVENLMKRKRCVLVLRKQNSEFFNRIVNDENVFVCDLDEKLPQVTCVVMASGQSKRFGQENKLLATLFDKKLIDYSTDLAKSPLFFKSVAVTVHKEIYEICKEKNIDCIYHSFEDKSDAIKLAMGYIEDDPSAIMFLNSDQPLVSLISIEKLLLAFYYNKNCIIRLGYNDVPASPVIFPKETFKYLANIEKGESGLNAAKKSGLKTICVNADNEYEIFDVDTKDDLKELMET